jgi:hypothetical protein
MSEPLQGWHEFYFLVGTSAAALTGLMFVVVSINPDNIGRRPASGVRGFVTPTMVFFTTAFLVSALLLVPGLPQRSLAVLLMAAGIGGIVYMVWTRVHHHWHHGFPDQPPTRDTEDLVFFVSLPFVSYALVCLAALGLWLEKGYGAPTLAVATVLLVVTGIHNAWDLVIWMAQRRRPEKTHK